MKWIGLIIAVVILLGGGYFYFRNSVDKGQTVVSSQNSETDLIGTLQVKRINNQDVLFLELPRPINVKGMEVTEVQLDSSPVVMDLSDTSGQKSEVTGTFEDTQSNPPILHIHTMHDPTAGI